MTGRSNCSQEGVRLDSYVAEQKTFALNSTNFSLSSLTSHGNMIRKIISGGQTGVDRAGLDAAVNAGIPIGGYCPKGRLAEDGVIPEQYPLIELESPESCYRTEKNVVESDGTLILNKGILSEGTKLTHDFTVRYGKPGLIVQLDADRIIEPGNVIRWIKGQCINVLNIAGPRESKCSGGIHAEAYAYLEKVFMMLKESAK